MDEPVAISIAGFTAVPTPADFGPAPMLQWVRIQDLVVDPAYQRRIGQDGRSNINAIRREFRWTRFAPIVVSPIAGGKLAIIDGQHRTTAAALLGFETVPCQVVIADGPEQAAAFAAINGRVTRTRASALHAALLAAGDPAAVELDELCRCAEVTILRHPRQSGRLKPGETLAIGALKRGLALVGRPVLITALQCVTMTENHKPGVLRAAVIGRRSAACSTSTRSWPSPGEALLAAFDKVDIEAEIAKLPDRHWRFGSANSLYEALRDRVAEEMAGSRQGGGLMRGPIGAARSLPSREGCDSPPRSRPVRPLRWPPSASPKPTWLSWRSCASGAGRDRGSRRSSAFRPGRSAGIACATASRARGRAAPSR